MFDRIREFVLRLIRLPHAPTPPAGAPGSVRVFRAGRNQYRVLLARWLLGQIGAAIGICVSLSVLSDLEANVMSHRATPITRSSPAGANLAPSDPANPRKPLRHQLSITDTAREGLTRAAIYWPDWMFLAVRLFEYLGIIGFLCQIPITLAAVRLQFEMHWYIVTDRSLRIRTGLMQVQESTMSFANLQQVSVEQGPLQRLLGIADVQVQSAGGGGSAQRHGHKPDESLHTGIFHGVDNAPEVRDLILERLRLFRSAGLGDPDEKAHAHVAPAAAPSVPSSSALDAARELLAEVRALRQVI
jgi:hypothetical protein